MHPRQIARSTVRCILMLPMGLKLFSNESTHQYKMLDVSTVCLSGGHLESPIAGMLDAETGFETMVFLKETSFFGLYKQYYKTRAESVRGHKATIKKLLAGKLPLSIIVDNYTVLEILDGAQSAA